LCLVNIGDPKALVKLQQFTLGETRLQG